MKTPEEEKELTKEDLAHTAAECDITADELAPMVRRALKTRMRSNLGVGMALARLGAEVAYHAGEEKEDFVSLASHAYDRVVEIHEEGDNAS